MQYTTNTIEQTYHIGNTIAKNLNPGDIVLLFGEMGSGKTTLTKGILSYFGIHPDSVVSPTFSLMQYYANQNTSSPVVDIIHVDTYRLHSEEELIDIGITDYLGSKHSICIIEWPEKLKKLLNNKKTIHITCESLTENSRRITIDGLSIPHTI